MPEFPRYQSKGVLTTQQPSFQAPADSTGQILEQNAKLGQQVQDVSLKWSNAVDTIQKTTSEANFKSGLLDIQNRATNDPSYNNSDQYFKEIEKLKTDNLKGFASKTAETEMALEFGYQGNVGRIQIDNLYKKKMIDVGQASTMKLLDLEAQNPTPNMEKNISSILNTQVQSGVMGHKDAYELQQKYIKQGKFNSFLSDMNADPKATESNLSKNAYQFDIKELESAKKTLQIESGKIKATTENQLLTDYLNGSDISESSIKEMMTKGKIDANFAESMIKKLNDFKPDALSQDKTYIEFQNRVMETQAKGDKATTEEIVKLMTDTMQAHSQGLLDKADVERILKDRNELVQKKLEHVAEDVLNKTHPKNWLERLSFWSDEYANKKPEIKARMYRKLIDGMAKGGDPGLLSAKIVDDEIGIQLTENLNKPDRVYANDPGTKERKAYSDDGGATWTDIKTGKPIK